MWTISRLLADDFQNRVQRYEEIGKQMTKIKYFAIDLWLFNKNIFASLISFSNFAAEKQNII